MSDEEKKAIIELKHYCNLTQYWKNIEYTKPEFDDYVKTILNLIEKQSKEIEELKEKFSDEKIRNTVIKRYREVIEKDYVSNDKIKAKIEEVKEEKEHYLEINDEYNAQICDCIIEEYESLLEKE